MKPSEGDNSIDLTLGNFNDAAPIFAGSEIVAKHLGITTGPNTPLATRQMPPLAYPQPKQSASFSNGVTSSQSSVNTNSNSNSRTYNNNNNLNTINNNSIAINSVNSYQQKLSSSSSSSTLVLAPPPQSRANNSNSSNITASNNTFVRPSDNKPLINGRSGYTTASQSNKHEVNITFWFGIFPLHSALILSTAQSFPIFERETCAGRVF